MKQKKTEKSNLIIWGEHELSSQKTLSWSIGDLMLWCKRKNQEIQIAYIHRSPNEYNKLGLDEPPKDIIWSRWALKKDHPAIRLSPLFPDRPVVIIPESIFKLNREAQAKIYARVPIWVKIETAERESITLFEIPSVLLSNTWFGTFIEGELCYSITSSARREAEPDSYRPHLAICPLQLINKSEDDLPVEKICLRVSNLSVFFDDIQLWSNETKITYTGKEASSQIEFSHKKPSEAPSSSLISAPRHTVRKSIVAQTFASLKDLPGIGILIN